MSAILPINLDDLLYCRGVESERVEFKVWWDPQTTGHQVLRTICAFANDYHNLNGGYIVIGVGERDGRAALPPSGLSAKEVDCAQRWIRGNCNRLDPPCAPMLSPEMEVSGSPVPRFEFDEQRAYFQAWLGLPVREVEDAYRKAIELLPEEPGFVRELKSIRASRQR